MVWEVHCFFNNCKSGNIPSSLKFGAMEKTLGNIFFLQCDYLSPGA